MVSDGKRICVKDQPPKQYNPKPKQYDTVDPAKDLDIVWREFFPDPLRHHYFQDICGQHKYKTSNKSNDPVFYRKCDERSGRC